MEQVLDCGRGNATQLNGFAQLWPISALPRPDGWFIRWPLGADGRRIPLKVEYLIKVGWDSERSEE